MTPDPTKQGAAAQWRRSLPWLVLLGGLVLSMLLARWAHQTQQAERRALFERRADAFCQALTGRVQSYIDTLPGLRIFWMLKNTPNDAEFTRYVDAISLQQRFPGLALTFVAEYVAAADRERFIGAVQADRSQQAEGHPGFTIVPPGDRPSYMVLRHGLPASLASIGYDLYDPTQGYRAAVDAAVDSGGYVATGPTVLARDRLAGVQPQLTTVVIRAATYRGGVAPASVEARRQALAGLVGVSFRTLDLVRSVLPPELKGPLHIMISDVAAGAAGKNALVFDSAWLADPGQASAPRLGEATVETVRVADRLWRVSMAPVEGFSTAPWTPATALPLLFGALLSVLLAMLTKTLVDARRRADEQAANTARELEAEKQRLARSENRYRDLFECSLDAVLRIRANGEVVAANPAACTLLGRTEAELQALAPRGLVDETDPRFDALLEARDRDSHSFSQIRMRRVDGSVFEAEVSTSIYRDGDGQVMGGVILRDVTERQAQAERQARLAAIVDATPDFVTSTDPQGRHVFVNRAARELLGLAEDAPLTTLRRADFHPAWAAHQIEQEALPQALRHGLWRGESAVRDAAGQDIPVSMVIIRQSNAAGEATHLSTIARDVRELKQAEAERETLAARLREAQKLESIGTLAGGVAHDFNNVLAAILGNVGMAQQDLPPAHPTQQQLALIHDAAARARDLVRQILTFSRRSPEQRKVQALAPQVQQAVALLQATLPASAQLQVAISDLPMPVLADAAQLQQVVLNLCTNAWQALPDEQGHIAVSLAPVRISAAQPGPGGLPDGDYALLQVRDDGSGMDAATRRRAFEPFFTTKPVGQGTGLGLSVVHGVVASAGGGIDIESSPGHGTCFRIYLPLSSEAPAGVPPTGRLGPSQRGRGEPLLYVDDDAVVALTLQTLLEREGYRVTRVADADEALAALAAAQPPFALVITDYHMPGKSGLALAEHLRDHAPGLPVIVTSGSVTEEMQLRTRAAGVRAVLLKERSLEELAALVQEVLASRQGSA